MGGSEFLVEGDLLQGGEALGGEDDDDFGGARVDEAHAGEGGGAFGGAVRAGDAEGVDPDGGAGGALEDY